MQARLVLWAVEVSPAHTQHLSIVPPQKAHDREIYDPGDNDRTPLVIVPHVLGRQPQDPRHAVRVDRFRIVDRNQNRAAGHCHNGKHIPAHVQKAHEDGGVHAGKPYEICLFRPPQRHDPGKRAPSQLGRGAGFVGMF